MPHPSSLSRALSLAKWLCLSLLHSSHALSPSAAVWRSSHALALALTPSAAVAANSERKALRTGLCETHFHMFLTNYL